MVGCVQHCVFARIITNVFTKSKFSDGEENFFRERLQKFWSFKEDSRNNQWSFGFMPQATAAEVQMALQSLWAHLQAPDDHLVNYTTSVWRELKVRINFRQNTKKRKKFKEMIRDGFEMYRARKQNNQHVTRALWACVKICELLIYDLEVECEGGSEDDEVEAMTVEDADFLATECEIESERIKANESMQIEKKTFWRCWNVWSFGKSVWRELKVRINFRLDRKSARSSKRWFVMLLKCIARENNVIIST